MSNNPSQIVVEADIHGQPGQQRGHPDRIGQPAPTDLSSQPGFENLPETLAQINLNMGNMAAVLERLVARDTPPQDVLPRVDPDEEPPAKRQRNDDELSTVASDQDIEDLLNPSRNEEIDSDAPAAEASQDSAEFIKSLEAEFSETVPVGPPVNESLANIAKKRWGFTLNAEKLKPLLERHAQPDNCELSVAQVNKEIWGQLSNFQKKADKRLQNIQQTIQKVTFALLKSSEHLVGDKTDQAKNILSQNIDAIALLGHVVGDVSALRREKIKPVLKPEYASLCAKSQEGDSKNLFGEDLAKQVRDAKETSAISKKIGASSDSQHKVPHRPYNSKKDYRRFRDNYKSYKSYTNDRYIADRFLSKGQKKPQGKLKKKD